MIDCIFTLDYEIYGNGLGSLRKQVLEPCAEMLKVFDRYNAKMVVFVEVAELEMIGKYGTDDALDEVLEQIKMMHANGHEIALHLHPQWYNASYTNNRWQLDNNEYNLCVLPKKRIDEIVDRGIGYLRKVVSADFTPVSFRAGNWLFQPTSVAASVLSDRGIRIDSSVFKGGVQHRHRLDYRRSLRNGDCWRFADDVNVPEPTGSMTEIPIFTRMVPSWKMATGKRRSFGTPGNGGGVSLKVKLQKLLDRMRLFYPLKFDFCRMTIDELTSMLSFAEKCVGNENGNHPMVAIGHTKDFNDEETLDAFLQVLKSRTIGTTTLQQFNKTAAE